MSNKDPAMLLYTSDFLTGAALLSMKERGQYITLICLQQQLGHLRLKDMERVTGKLSPALLEKFKADEEGNLYNPRAEEEIRKRAAHCQKQKENIKKRWCAAGTTTVLPLEDEDEVEDETENEKETKDQRERIETKTENENEGEAMNDYKTEAGDRVLRLYTDCINPRPTPSCADALRSYTATLGEAAVSHAVRIAADDNKRAWSYIKAILLRYAAEGVITDKDIARDEANRAARRAEKSADTNRSRVKFSRSDGGIAKTDLDYDDLSRMADSI